MILSIAGNAQVTVEDIDQPILNQLTEIAQIKKKLIGSWSFGENTSNWITFTKDNYLETYYNGLLESTVTFIISSTCDNEILSSGYFLISETNNGAKTCMYIDNADYNKTGILTLMSDNGRIFIFRKM